MRSTVRKMIWKEWDQRQKLWSFFHIKNHLKLQLQNGLAYITQSHLYGTQKWLYNFYSVIQQHLLVCIYLDTCILSCAKVNSWKSLTKRHIVTTHNWKWKKERETHIREKQKYAVTLFIQTVIYKLRVRTSFHLENIIWGICKGKSFIS